MTGDTGTTDARRQDGITGPVNALAIISNELMQTIRNAHLAVEDCVDGRGGSQALVRAAGLLNRLRDESIRIERDRMHPHRIGQSAELIDQAHTQRTVRPPCADFLRCAHQVHF